MGTIQKSPGYKRVDLSCNCFDWAKCENMEWLDCFVYQSLDYWLFGYSVMSITIYWIDTKKTYGKQNLMEKTSSVTLNETSDDNYVWSI